MYPNALLVHKKKSDSDVQSLKTPRNNAPCPIARALRLHQNYSVSRSNFCNSPWARAGLEDSYLDALA
jgi:hypothetical protein